MNLEVFLIVSIFVAFALAMDAFSVAIAAGAYYRNTSPRQYFRLSFHFGLFQFIMPIVGWLIGEQTVKLLQDYDHWVAFAILSFLGAKIIWEAVRGAQKEITKDISRGWSLIGLSIATSLDALAVGFSLSLLDGQIFFMSVIIGVVASLMTFIGIKIGEKLSSRFMKFANVLGGIILILVGTQIVLNHLGVI